MLLVFRFVQGAELENDTGSPILFHLILLHLIGELDEIQVARIEVLSLVENVQDFVEPDLHAAREDLFLLICALLDIYIYSYMILIDGFRYLLVFFFHSLTSAFTVVVEFLVGDRFHLVGALVLVIACAPAFLLQEVAVRVVGLVRCRADLLFKRFIIILKWHLLKEILRFFLFFCFFKLFTLN